MLASVKLVVHIHNKWCCSKIENYICHLLFLLLCVCVFVCRIRINWIYCFLNSDSCNRFVCTVLFSCFDVLFFEVDSLNLIFTIRSLCDASNWGKREREIMALWMGVKIRGWKIWIPFYYQTLLESRYELNTNSQNKRTSTKTLYT